MNELDMWLVFFPTENIDAILEACNANVDPETKKIEKGEFYIKWSDYSMLWVQIYFIVEGSIGQLEKRIHFFPHLLLGSGLEWDTIDSNLFYKIYRLAYKIQMMIDGSAWEP